MFGRSPSRWRDHCEGPQAATALRSSVRYAARGTSTTPSEARCSVCHWTSSNAAPGVVQPVDECHESDLRGIGLGREHRLAGEEPVDAHARTDHRRDARRGRSRPSAPTRVGTAPRTHRRTPAVIQPCGRRGSPQRSITSRNRVSKRTSNLAQLLRSDRLTRSPSSGRMPRGSGRPPAQHPLAHRHREQPRAVGREQRARSEVGADGAQSVTIGVVRLRQPPRRRARLRPAIGVATPRARRGAPSVHPRRSVVHSHDDHARPPPVPVAHPRPRPRPRNVRRGVCQVPASSATMGARAWVPSFWHTM